MPIRLGPDAARLFHIAGGEKAPRPFYLRRLAPWLCGQDLRRWWALWVVSWGLVAIGMTGWAWHELGGQRAAIAAVLLLALPGILGPPVVIPVGVDLPATGLALCAVLSDAHEVRWAAIALICVAAAVKESSPVWAALWAWSPLLLAGFVVPAVLWLMRRRWEGPDPLGERFQHIADHPVRTALAAHEGRWRDAWLMVAPWGACLIGLYGADWRLGVVLAVAYAQMLVATDSVRLYQHGAGPAMAFAAASVVPIMWAAPALAVHVFWWRAPERI